MNTCNYLYNISLLELFVEIEHHETEIEHGHFGFWIEVGLDYSMRFDRYGHSFNFVHVKFWRKGIHIEYNKNAYNKNARQIIIFVSWRQR